MTVVPLYAAFLALYYILLSVRVLRCRWQVRVSLGTGDSELLQRLVRAHGNFAEYVPFCLLLLAFTEWQGSPHGYLHMLCLLLVAGRLAHATALTRTKRSLRLRIFGMVSTFAVLAGSAVFLAAHAIANMHWL